jgi:hypothetical protein
VSNKKDVVGTAISGIGIIISILLAFAIDASWDAWTEGLVEEAVIEGIREEFETNLVLIDELLVEHRWADTALVAFFAAPTPDSEIEAESVVGDLTAGLLVGDLLDPSTGTLEMLVNSGRLDLISDAALRSLLWTWKRQSEDLEDDAAGMQSNVRDNRLLLGRLGVRGINTDLLPSWREQFDRLRSSQELSAQARTVLVDRRLYQAELSTLRATTELVLAQID